MAEMTKSTRLIAVVILWIVASASTAVAQQQVQSSDQELLHEVHQPIGTLRALSAPAEFQPGIGDHDRTAFALNLQPYRAELLPDSAWWKVRSLAVVPIKYGPDVTQQQGGTAGLGDPNVSFFWSPGLMKSVDIGIGPIFSIPLATDESLGSGKWSAGISMIGGYRTGRWTIAGRANNLWSFAGSSERDDVGRLFFQYIVVYQLRDTWYLISSPFATANWKADPGEQWLVPFGGGIGKTLRRQNHAIDLQAHLYSSVIHPESDPYPDWTVRLTVQLLFLSRQ
jgi:hypothetical protein